MRVILAGVFAMIFAISLVAQSPTGSLSGIVFDPDAKVVPDADIIVVNDLTRVQYETKTNDAGLYSVPNLPPGLYRVQASKIGFKTLIRPDITVNVQDSITVNFTLPVGAASIAVTVEGGAPMVNTTDASVSTVVDRNFVGNLPLNGRSFNTLLQLTPGVVIAPSSQSEPGQFSVVGQRTDANNFLVDGVSANFGVSPGYLGQTGAGNSQAFSALGGTSSLASVEALQEFRIETSTFAPEFGRSPGAQVVLTTRSGTNDFHGELYEYFRNTVMDANDWFGNALGLERQPERHNDFGGVIGGPFRKDKSFFFLSYEGARLDLPAVYSLPVPSAYARSIATPPEAVFVDAFPKPSDPTVIPGVYAALFNGGSANRARLDAGSVRVDHRFNDRLSLFGRYNNAPSETVTRGGRGVSPSSLSTTTVNTQTLTLGAISSFGSRVSNSLRGNYSTQSADIVYAMDSFGGATPLDPETALGGVSAANTYAYFYAFDIDLAVIGPYAKNQTRQANLVDDLSQSAGKHGLKFGGDYRAIFLDSNPRHGVVTLVSPSVQTFLTTGKATPSAETNLSASLLSQALSLYAQDTWRARPRLTLTYGLRWELSPAPSARGNTMLASWVNVNDPSSLALAKNGTPLWQTAYGNVAPRLGIAFSPLRNSDLVIRIGAGVFYDLSAGSSAQLAVEFPNSASASYPAVSLPLTNGASYFPAISVTPPYPTALGVAPDLSLPRSYQWNLSVEKPIGQRQSVSASYVGQAGRELLRTEALYQPNSHFSSEFLLMKNEASSNYHALQVQYRRRVSPGLQAVASYTFSHSLDNASSDQVIGLSHAVLGGAADYSSSDFDVRHSFSTGLTYVSPRIARDGLWSILGRNWTLASVIVARSGFPFNATVFSASPDPGGFATSRPDRVPGQPLYLYGSECVAALGPPCAGGRGLNPAAFAVPLTARQGTEGRNDIPGFGLFQMDLSIGRKFPLTERLNLAFQADAFNLLNHPNFTNPLGYVEFGSFYLQSQQMLNRGLGGLNSLFQEGGPRSLQLSLKLSF